VPNVLICSYLEPELVDRVAAVDPVLRIAYRPDLIPAPRFVADHTGHPLARDAAQRRAWAELMAAAEVLFDFDYADPASLLRDGHGVRWLQATSSGIGQTIERHGLARSGVTFTTAAGVHARPLAEFVVWGMLAFAKGYPVARRQQREQVWRRFVGAELAGATLAIVGLGNVGREVARLARALGVRVLGSKRNHQGEDAAALGVDELFEWSDLHALIARADYLCLVAPHTRETQGMLDSAAFAAMKPGCVLINIGRGSLVDEGALLTALDDGSLRGAVLDVTLVEPLPQGHPLWSRDDVIVFPHSASTSVRENERLTDLFCDNLRRYLGGVPLRNVFDPGRQY
jgi:glyoxylate/hydroxypyruvate reductase